MDVDERMARARIDNPAWAEEELRPWAESKEQLDLDFCTREREVPDPIGEFAARISCRSPRSTGDTARGGLVGPGAIGRFQRDAGSAVTAVTVGDAGHNVRRDAPAAFRLEVRAFLRPSGVIQGVRALRRRSQSGRPTVSGLRVIVGVGDGHASDGSKTTTVIGASGATTSSSAG